MSSFLRSDKWSRLVIKMCSLGCNIADGPNVKQDGVKFKTAEFTPKDLSKKEEVERKTLKRK
jgi:hypothetical protein